MQWRVEPADDDGQSVHRLEDTEEVRLLCSSQLLERRGLLVCSRREDHPPHDRQAVVSKEHVLGPAQADPLGSEMARVRRIVAGIGIGTNPEASRADLVSPAEQLCQFRGRFGCDERNRSDHHRAFRAVDRYHVPLADDSVSDAEELVGCADT